jgi:hypothetical protein
VYSKYPTRHLELLERSMLGWRHPSSSPCSGGPKLDWGKLMSSLGAALAPERDNADAVPEPTGGGRHSTPTRAVTGPTRAVIAP